MAGLVRRCLRACLLAGRVLRYLNSDLVDYLTSKSFLVLINEILPSSYFFSMEDEYIVKVVVVLRCCCTPRQIGTLNNLWSSDWGVPLR